MFQISQLSVFIDQKLLLNNISLEIPEGAFHVLMGPNGSGKSTLAQVIMGNPDYTMQGSILLDGTSITQLSVDKRAQKGIFLAFQYPYEIPGITVFSFLKEAYQAIHKNMISATAFEKMLFEKMDVLKIDHQFAHRFLNHGFSGGEKKRIELLQLLILKPRFAMLDEIDSGLDVDAIKIVAYGIEHARLDNPSMSILLITHYPRLLSYVQADAVHIMHQGTIIQSGVAALAYAIEQKGYDAYSK